MAPVAESLLKILVCPGCRHPVLESGNKLHCRNPECSLAYPVRNGIPVMLIEEAIREPLPRNPPDA